LIEFAESSSKKPLLETLVAFQIPFKQAGQLRPIYQSPFRKGQLAKVTESFPDNLTELNISALKFYSKAGLYFKETISPIYFETRETSIEFFNCKKNQ